MYANGHRREDSKRLTKYLENVDFPEPLPPHVSMVGVTAATVGAALAMVSTTASHRTGTLRIGTLGGPG